MPVERLLREQTLGETRWAALDGGGLPIALFLERAHEIARRPSFGDRLTGRVRRLDTAMGGAFVDLGAKGDGFLRLKSGETFPEGAAIDVDVVAEGRRNKVARLRLAGPEKAAMSAAEHWRASLSGAVTAPVEDRPAGDSEVRSAFEDALAAAAPLRGGGRLRIEPTEALTATDIDTAGRAAYGGRAPAALAINIEAAGMLARQIHLRGLGGLVVLDCVAPIDKAAGAQVRAAFLDGFRDVSARQVKALVPSVFGLMEISADWQLTPLRDRLLGADGAPTPETTALNGLRDLEASARANRMGRLRLTLPAPAFAWLSASGLNAEAELARTYGGRLAIAAGASAKHEVRPDP